jgi:hypothetical protein
MMGFSLFAFVRTATALKSGVPLSEAWLIKQGKKNVLVVTMLELAFR